MVFEIFTGLVGLLAVLYAGVAKYLQNKLVDRKEMEEMQAESRRLSAEFEKARKADDKKRMDKIMQEQMEFLPRMNVVMMKQLKPMLAIMIVFLAFIWVVGQIDPYTKDDVTVNMSDDGRGCDELAGDNIFTACYKLENSNGSQGKWTAFVKAYENDAELAKNETYFLYNVNRNESADLYVEQGTGEDLEVSVGKEEYYQNETVVVTAIPANMTKGSSFIIQLAPPRPIKIDKMQVTLSNGTYFRFELPLAIPILNVKTIYQPYWFFILISLISNLAISGILKYTGKKKDGEKK